VKNVFLKKEEVVSNEKNVFERLFKMWSTICKMIVDEIRDPEKVADALEKVIDVLQAIIDEPVEKMKTYLRQLFVDVELGATDGTETFESSGFGEIYGLAVPAASKGEATPATKATVWEMILDGIFPLLFRSFGEERKRWTEAQIVQFCRNYRDKLRVGGHYTFFKMKGDVAAAVFFGDSGQLKIYIYSLSHHYEWGARYRHRIVSLQ